VSSPDWRRDGCGAPEEGGTRSSADVLKPTCKEALKKVALCVKRWSESSAKDRSEAVCWWSEVDTEAHVGALCTCEHGEHVPTENTCRRSTKDASGQQRANAKREVATPFSFSLLIWGLCVTAVGGLVC